MIGLDKYKEYLIEYEQLNKEASEVLKEKEEKNQTRMIDIEETKSRVSKIKIAVMLFLMACAGFAYSIIKEYGELIYILYYFIACAIIYLLITLYEINLKRKIKELKDPKNLELEHKIIKDFNEHQQKIYSLTIYIIAINEYNYELQDIISKCISDEWEKYTFFVKKSLDLYMNNVFTFDKCKDYLDNYILNEEKMGK